MSAEGPCVRLFVSVDLVGSTDFKQQKEAEERPGKVRSGPPWATLFSEFYNLFPRVFERKFESVKLPKRIRPKLVKTIGDEILLQTMIGSSLHAQDIVSFVAAALPEYTKRNLCDSPLLLKATAWIAGFPIHNHRIRFEEEGGVLGGQDFIGPSIDTGFRLTRFATPSKLVVSVDLALLLLARPRPLDLYFDGTESMKGVLSGRPYPIIWHKVRASDSELQDAELKLRHEINKDDLRGYCHAFIKACDGTWLIVPYLPKDADFKTIPELHKNLMQTFKKVDERNMLTGPPDPGDHSVARTRGPRVTRKRSSPTARRRQP